MEVDLAMETLVMPAIECTSRGLSRDTQISAAGGHPGKLDKGKVFLDMEVPKKLGERKVNSDQTRDEEMVL